MSNEDKPRLNSGITLFSRYEVDDFVGSGSFGTVSAGYDTFTKRRVALKTIGLKRKNIAVREKRNIMHLNKDECKNVIRILDFLTVREETFINENKTNNIVYVIVTPLYDFNLYEAIKEVRKARGGIGGLDELDMDEMIVDVLSGLDFIHKRGIMHLDLKPENIMKSSVDSKPCWVIIDFGNAECPYTCEFYYEAQTSWYRAPEVCVGGKYTSTADIWSFGCILFEAEDGAPLFKFMNSEAILWRHVWELGPPPMKFLNVPTPRNKPIKYFRKPKQGNSLEFMGRQRPPPQHDRLLTKPLKNNDLLMKCLKWMPYERNSAQQLLIMKKKEVEQKPRRRVSSV